MQINIPIDLFKRSGESSDNVANTLYWILGYFSSEEKPMEMFSLIDVKPGKMVQIDISDDSIEQIKKKFKSDKYEQIVPLLLIFAYSIGGME
jgi:hypothetical protein